MLIQLSSNHNERSRENTMSEFIDVPQVTDPKPFDQNNSSVRESQHLRICHFYSALVKMGDSVTIGKT